MDQLNTGINWTANEWVIHWSMWWKTIPLILDRSIQFALVTAVLSAWTYGRFGRRWSQSLANLSRGLILLALGLSLYEYGPGLRAPWVELKSVYQDGALFLAVSILSVRLWVAKRFHSKQAGAGMAAFMAAGSLALTLWMRSGGRIEGGLPAILGFTDGPLRGVWYGGLVATTVLGWVFLSFSVYFMVSFWFLKRKKSESIFWAYGTTWAGIPWIWIGLFFGLVWRLSTGERFWNLTGFEWVSLVLAVLFYLSLKKMERRCLQSGLQP